MTDIRRDRLRGLHCRGGVNSAAGVANFSGLPSTAGIPNVGGTAGLGGVGWLDCDFHPGPTPPPVPPPPGPPVIVAYSALNVQDGPFSNQQIEPVFPADVQVDDIAFLSVHRAVTFEGSVSTFSTPVGWNVVNTRHYLGNSGVSKGRGGLYWKRCDGTEGNTIQTMNSSGGSNKGTLGGYLVIVRGCRTTGTPYEDWEEHYGTSPTAPNMLLLELISPSVAELRGAIGFLTTPDTTSYIITPPTGYTEIVTFKDAGDPTNGTPNHMFCCYKSSQGILATPQVNFIDDGSITNGWSAFHLLLVSDDIPT